VQLQQFAMAGEDNQYVRRTDTHRGACAFCAPFECCGGPGRSLRVHSSRTHSSLCSIVPRLGYRYPFNFTGALCRSVIGHAAVREALRRVCPVQAGALDASAHLPANVEAEGFLLNRFYIHIMFEVCACATLALTRAHPEVALWCHFEHRTRTHGCMAIKRPGHVMRLAHRKVAGASASGFYALRSMVDRLS